MLAALLMAALVHVAPQPQPARDAELLQPLQFLEGSWDGEGTSTYGPYKFKATITRRGRWLLGTTEVTALGTTTVSIQATSMMTREADGQIVSYLFDAGGPYRFTGTHTGDTITLEWRDGEAYRRLRFAREPDGRIHQVSEMHLPSQKPPMPVDVNFDSYWKKSPTP